MFKKSVLLPVIAFGLGAVFTFLLAPQSKHSALDSEEKKPLYWVAPMDANYRRDAPGKSPMGMD